MIVLDSAQRFRCARGGLDAPAFTLKVGLQRHAHTGFVVHHQHGLSCLIVHKTGNSMWKVVPLPNWLLTEMFPWCCSTILWHTVKPNPGLCLVVLNPGSKMREMSSGRMPLPVSATSTTAIF